MITLRTVNKITRPMGLMLVRGEGYFYWLDLQETPLDIDSEMVYRINHLTLEQWVDRAQGVVEELNIRKLATMSE